MIFMKEEKYLEIIKSFSDKLSKFSDGRIDYRESDTAPVLNVFIKYNDKILLLKRSDKVRAYKNKWNSIGGYLDEIVPLEKKVLEELSEELGIEHDYIQEIKYADSHELYDDEIKLTWIIFPVLVVLNTQPKINLDWEHTDYKWIDPRELSKFDTVTGLEDIWKKL